MTRSATGLSRVTRPWQAGQPGADDEVVRGLRAPSKRLPASLLHHPRGARLRDRVRSLDAYYLTRTELALLEANLPVIAAMVGRGARVIEPACGEALAARVLLRGLHDPAGYVPIDDSAEQVTHTAAGLRAAFPGLEVQPVCADHLTGFAVPAPTAPVERTLMFFPGAAIGALDPDAAQAFLARLGEVAGPRAMLLLGTDSTNDPEVLRRAYEDEHGATAELHLDVLRHVNRIRDAAFDPSTFIHKAIWNPDQARIEMHLISRCSQTVIVAGSPIHLKRGESIVTEHAYKYQPEVLAGLLAHAGWLVRRVFVDDERPVRLWLCEQR